MGARGWGAHLLPPSDADLGEINSMLDWHAGTQLPDGRILGRLDRRPGKRSELARVPDSRIRLLNRLVPLRDKRVLEIGCFEGIHTIGLRRYCRRVTAVDVRPSNVIKTLTRLSYHGLSARVFQFDAEQITSTFPYHDVVFHVGVLYHLMRPVEHIMVLGRICNHLLLDTHIVGEEEPETLPIEVNGRTFRGAYRREGGWEDPFSGKDDRAVWLTEKSLYEALADAGFNELKTLQRRVERNGHRLLLLAERGEQSGA